MSGKGREDNMRDPKVEELSAKLHEIYQIEARRQGDVRHHDDYEALKENTKEFDRVLARYIIDRESELIERLRSYLKEGVNLGDILAGRGGKL